MKLYVLDVISKVNESGNMVARAAIRATGKNGDFLMVASVPPDFVSGETYDKRVVFGNNGNFVLPY